MNLSLGKFLIILLFLNINLFASYVWSSKIAKQNVLVDEAVAVNFRCDFDDLNELVVIEFLPKDSDIYRVELLREKEQIVDGKRENVYEFVLFFKKEGSFDLDFTALMRTTTKESIENTVIGRDNAEDFDFSDKTITLPRVHVDVKKAPHKIVGEYKLWVDVKKSTIKAYEPLALKFHLQGVGTLKDFKGFHIEQEGVKVFYSNVQKDLKLQADGYHVDFTQAVSIVSAKDFTLKPYSFSYSDLDAQLQQIETKTLAIKVQEDFKRKELLDLDVDDTQEFSFSYLWYLLTFLSGLAIGYLLRGVSFAKSKDNTNTLSKIDDDKKLLSMLAMSTNARDKKLLDAYEKGEIASIKELRDRL